MNSLSYIRTASPVLLLAVLIASSVGKESSKLTEQGAQRAPINVNSLPPEKRKYIDQSIERALAWLSSRQLDNGSFPTHIGGQPGVTALATMAFLAGGHHPSQGQYGKNVDEAINFLLSCQREDGMFLLDTTNMPVMQWERGSHTGLYNHAISCLMLSEAYGLIDKPREPKVRQAIERGLAFARMMQQRKQRFDDDQGGFRYFKPLNGFAGKGDADLSVTGWYVMFFRSAKNAGFDVPEAYVNEAIEFVERCYDPQEKAFYYGLHGHDRTYIGRAMTGAGLVCLAAAGKQDETISKEAGKWLLDHPFDVYGEQIGWYDRFHYGAYYCSVAMMQLGGDYWSNFYPPLAETLVENQQDNGSWPPEQACNDRLFGSEYSTSLSVLTLTSTYQLLPIHQR